MITVELINFLRTIATHNVNSNSVEWFIETCYRHYSKTYHTPLHEVKKILTPPEVILIFFEDAITALPPESQLNNKNKWLSARQPVLPNTSDSSDLYVDEEAEEELLLDALINKLQKEQMPPQSTDPDKQKKSLNERLKPTPPPEDIIEFDLPPES